MVGTIVILVILAVIVVIAIIQSKKHFAGQGSCCGGGSGEILDKKELNGKAIEEKTVDIEGMHCENCATRITNAINNIDGAVCKVNLKKNNAVIDTDREIEDKVIKDTIERLDYKVTNIKTKKLA